MRLSALLAAVALSAASCGAPAQYEHISSVRTRTAGPDSVVLRVRYPGYHRREDVFAEVLAIAARETQARGYSWFTITRGELRELAAAPDLDESDGASGEAGLILVKSKGGVGGRPSRRYWREQDFTVQMFKGEKPADAPGYVAAEVLAAPASPGRARHA